MGCTAPPQGVARGSNLRFQPQPLDATPRGKGVRWLSIYIRWGNRILKEPVGKGTSVVVDWRFFGEMKRIWWHMQ